MYEGALKQQRKAKKAYERYKRRVRRRSRFFGWIRRLIQKYKTRRMNRKFRKRYGR